MPVPRVPSVTSSAITVLPVPGVTSILSEILVSSMRHIMAPCFYMGGHDAAECNKSTVTHYVKVTRTIGPSIVL